MNVALKEWAVVCQALESGRQILLLRKGGIYESGGEFELEHRRFLLFPTYLHQNPAMLKTPQQEGWQAAAAEPSQVQLSSAAEVSDIVPMTSRAVMDALDAEHVWTAPLIDMRFNYKPRNPLYLILLRVYRLAEPVMLENTPDYAGCKSWVPLGKAVSTKEARPAMEEAAYERRRSEILDRVRSGARV